MYYKPLKACQAEKRLIHYTEPNKTHCVELQDIIVMHFQNCTRTCHFQHQFLLRSSFSERKMKQASGWEITLCLK